MALRDKELLLTKVAASKIVWEKIKRHHRDTRNFIRQQSRVWNRQLLSGHGTFWSTKENIYEPVSETDKND